MWPIGYVGLLSTREEVVMNVVCVSGTIKAEPTISWTKNGKPQTSFELIVPNDDSPGYFTKESVLIVGAQAEPLCERLEVGDEVEITGKLQRGQVVCFKVHVRQPALAGVPDRAHDASPEYRSGSDEAQINLEPARRPRKRPYPKAALEGGFQN
jgi:hypothetical protein